MPTIFPPSPPASARQAAFESASERSGDGCPAQIFFKRRARKTVFTSTAPNVTFALFASAMANRRGCRRAVRTKARGNGCIRSRRYGQASASNSWTACRRANAVAFARQRRAKADGDRMGQARGQFPDEAPVLKLDGLPSTPSSATGMMGASTSFMMRSKPRRNGSICPMRVIWPSAKMQTTSPFRMASLAVCSEWSISRGRCSEEMGITPRIRANGFIQAFRKCP